MGWYSEVSRNVEKIFQTKHFELELIMPSS